MNIAEQCEHEHKAELANAKAKRMAARFDDPVLMCEAMETVWHVLGKSCKYAYENPEQREAEEIDMGHILFGGVVEYFEELDGGE